MSTTTNPPVKPPAPPPAPKIKAWAQDTIAKPASSGNAHVDPILVGQDKEQLSVPLDFTYTAAGVYLEIPFQVGETFYFVISNVSIQRYVTATQAASALKPGYLTLRDDSSKARIFKDVPLSILNTQPGLSLRDIWPLPWPIGAGGSVTAIIDIPPTAGLTDTTAQIVLEGWRDFSI